MFDQKRYNRNILIKEIGEEGQKKLFSSKILVAGAGGLGSTVLMNLSALGVGHVGIIDDDQVELSNLNRQYIHKFADLSKAKVDSAKEHMEEFNPDIEIKTFNLRLNEENCENIISEYDLIVDCFDSFESKFLLNKIAVEQRKTLVHGGVSEFYGQVTVIATEETACLRCLFPDADEQTQIKKGVISPSVSLIASLQSMEVLKLLLNIGKPLKNRLLTYDGLNSKFKEIKLKKNSHCPLCS